MRTSSITAAVVVGLVVCGYASVREIQDEQRQEAPPAAARAAPLTIEAVRVTPANPAPGALCQLSITVVNGGERTASRFRFAVKVNARAVEAYARGRYLQTIEPGQSAELRLYNFWNVDPRPAGLEVEVALVGADWVKGAPDPDGVTAWSSLGVVTELPPAKRVTIPSRVSRK